MRQYVTRLSHYANSYQIPLLTAFAVILTCLLMISPVTTPAFRIISAASPKRLLPIHCVDTPDKRIAITFDAAWGADDTDSLLQTLRDEGVKATFFLCGTWVDKYPEEVKKIHAEGHDIGSHGNTHAHGGSLGYSQNQAEIQGVHDKIKALVGIDMKLFRPPYGEYNNTVLDAAGSLGYYTIQWDVDTNGIKSLYQSLLVGYANDVGYVARLQF